MKTLAAALIALMPSCAFAQSSSTVTLPNSSSTVTFIGNPLTTTCTITHRKGQIVTSGCDFSLSLLKPRFTPKDDGDLVIEFEQPRNVPGR